MLKLFLDNNIQLMSKGNTVTIVEVLGNECADELLRQGLEAPPMGPQPMCYISYETVREEKEDSLFFFLKFAEPNTWMVFYYRRDFR